MTRYRLACFAALLAATALPSRVAAQPLGTFRWQLQPFCNVVTVAVTQNGAIYRLEGTDDQCGGDAASVTGTAFPNADGTIGFGLNVVTAPGGRPVHVDAEITLGSFSGTWRDSAGASGSFAFTPGAGSGGSPRPLPSTIVLRPDGGFAASGVEGVGAIPAEGAGTRMMWYPGKSAFRAGLMATDAWDDPKVGRASVAFGGEHDSERRVRHGDGHRYGGERPSQHGHGQLLVGQRKQQHGHGLCHDGWRLCQRRDGPGQRRGRRHLLRRGRTRDRQWRGQHGPGLPRVGPHHGARDVPVRRPVHDRRPRRLPAQPVPGPGGGGRCVPHQRRAVGRRADRPRRQPVAELF